MNVPVPVNGLLAGIPPLRVIRRILPLRMFLSRLASFAPPQPLFPA